MSAAFFNLLKKAAATWRVGQRVDKIYCVGLVFVVRRGALRRFDRLKQAATDLPVDVIWDRRTSHAPKDGPRQARRTLAERRKQPSFTWTAADFVVVEKEGVEEEGA